MYRLGAYFYIHSRLTRQKKHQGEMDQLHQPNQIESIYLPLRVFIHAGDALATTIQVWAWLGGLHRTRH